LILWWGQSLFSGGPSTFLTEIDESSKVCEQNIKNLYSMERSGIASLGDGEGEWMRSGEKRNYD
jgi:hypothetical protein